MELKGKLIVSMLGAAMVALPMTAPVLAEPADSINPNYVQKVDWWWDHYGHDRDEYANHGWHRGHYEWRGKRNACERARGLQAQVWQDRNSGHPAAARDVQEEANAARAACYNHR